MSNLNIPALPAFVDIETVSQLPSFEQANEALEYIWKSRFSKEIKLLIEQKQAHKSTETIRNEHYMDNAAFYAEFGKIVAISIGIYDRTNDNIRIKTLCGDDEKQMLEEFKKIIGSRDALCAHNGIEFDFRICLAE